MAIPEKWCCMPFWTVFAFAVLAQIVEIVLAATSYQRNWFPILLHLTVGIMYALLLVLKDQYCFTLSTFIVTIIMLSIAFFGLFWNLFVYVIGDGGEIQCAFGGAAANAQKFAMDMTNAIASGDINSAVDTAETASSIPKFTAFGMEFDSRDDCESSWKLFHIIKFLIDLALSALMIVILVQTWRYYKGHKEKAGGVQQAQQQTPQVQMAQPQ